MNVTDRDALERQFISDLTPVFRRQFERARLQPTAIPYGQFQQELVGAMLQNLLAAFTAGGAALIVGRALVVSQGTFDAVGSRWALGFAQLLAEKTVAISRSLAADVVDRAMRVAPTDRQRTLDMGLALVFLSDRRIENIAITEVTRGLSMGENAVAIPLAEHPATKLIAIWQCVEEAPGVPDQRVCPICAPFDRRTFEVWGREFPDGPPAHPRCRCWRRWLKADEWARMQMPS